MAAQTGKVDGEDKDGTDQQKLFGHLFCLFVKAGEFKCKDIIVAR